MKSRQCVYSPANFKEPNPVQFAFTELMKRPLLSAYQTDPIAQSYVKWKYMSIMLKANFRVLGATLQA